MPAKTSTSHTYTPKNGTTKVYVSSTVSTATNRKIDKMARMNLRRGEGPTNRSQVVAMAVAKYVEGVK